MRVRILILLILALLISQLGISKAEAFIFISEFLADPASGLSGDANNDSTRHTYEDEFIEIYNSGTEQVNISNWTLSDSSDQRHEFSLGTILLPNQILVVFGGGNPESMLEDWIIADSLLKLNNSGDIITLSDADANVIDSYAYGSEAGDNQSIVRSPEGTKSDWIKHTLLPNANGKLFSPGYFINEIDVPGQSTVPEPGTIFSLAFGFGVILLKRKNDICFHVPYLLKKKGIIVMFIIIIPFFYSPNVANKEVLLIFEQRKIYLCQKSYQFVHKKILICA